MMTVRVGIDVGGTKIAGVALDSAGRELRRARAETPRSYERTLEALALMVAELQGGEAALAGAGLSMPGLISRGGEIVRAVNLPWLEGRPVAAELSRRIGVPVGIANDANCFALSEATDGAAAGATVVFGAVVGTGVGGGLVIDGRPVIGASAVAGEWGHNALPWATAEDGEPIECACGRVGCLETWVSGAAVTRDLVARGGQALSSRKIARLAEAGDARAREVIGRLASRLARAFAAVINFLDPDVIVLGGGLSEIGSLYVGVPAQWPRFCVAPEPRVRLVRAQHGPDSGMRGAAWLRPAG
jgi:fructokinase